MLRKINAYKVESDEGFSIWRDHPEVFKYKKGDKIIEISVGDDPAKHITYIHASDAAKFYKMNEIEKNEMINNIKQAVKLLDWKFIVI